MTFLRIMFVKEHPYLYRQTNVRYGKQVKSYCMDRQQYHRHRVSGRIWLDRANAMLKFIYAQEKAKAKEQERS